jgi:hypothetical protein
MDRTWLVLEGRWRRYLLSLCRLFLLAAFTTDAAAAPDEKGYLGPPVTKKPAALSESKAFDNSAELRLKEGIDQYDLGGFDSAIRILANSREIGAGAPSTRIQAYKYLAFIYCVQNRITLCRLNFDKALALDPQFDLLPAERGHPQWGPVFEKAKRREGASAKDIFNNLRKP